ncbi:MAG TPA: CopD family protein [Solirubrobacterales bacterium]|nr:CopD family protein [Solirubrobacterales bacterium]
MVRRTLVAAALVLAILPSSAMAHAVLESTEPLSGSTSKQPVTEVVFKFSEPVEGNFGAIRVFDGRGARIDQGEVFHPGGRGAELGVHLKRGVPKGSYTATYRVISADSHPVAGGLVFSYGKATPTGTSVSQLLSQQDSAGRVTDIAFGASKAAQYGSIAAAVGAVFFLLVIYLRALATAAGAGGEWRDASEAFARRLRKVLLIVVGIGLLSSAAGIVGQGAKAAGVSYWSAIDSQIIGDVLDTRFGTVWGIRMLVWLGFGAILLGSLSAARRPVLRPASVGATGLAQPRLSPMWLALLALPLGFLVLSPALAGHASLEKPTWVLVPADALHVLAMSIWAGSLATLLFVLPAATRRLETADRTRLLAATLARFSPWAFASVMVLLATGLLQSWFLIGFFDEPSRLLDTPFGRAALIKFVILVGPLMALGAYNQRRLVPRLKELAATGQTPGGAGFALRRSLRAEIVLILGALGATAALTTYAPADYAPTGPISKTASLGPADVQLTVDPARVGPNEMHVYLIDKQNGTQYDKVKEMKVDLVLPAEKLGPLEADVRKAGPGHYVMNGALFGVSGEWDVKMNARVSEFDAYYASVKVRIE